MFSLGKKDYVVLFMAIGLLALFSCGLLASHMLMGHGEFCGSPVPISLNKESLFLNLLFFTTVFILLCMSTRPLNSPDLSAHDYKSSFNLFGRENDFSVFNPVSAFVLVRTVQRHVY